MRRTSFEDMNCSVAQCLEVVGEWWSLLVLRDVFLGVSRFDDFQRRLGISRNVLTERLDHLVDHGVLERIPYQEHPVRHDYRLTAQGRDLWPVITAMREWGERYHPAPEGPRVELVHKACGRRMHVVETCSHCGERVKATDVRAVPGPAAADTFPPDEMRHRRGAPVA